jgi:hypothetical protein
MPIEFRCSKCDRLLRTPDGTAGKSAKCPQCGTVTQVPELPPGPPPSPPGDIPPSPPQEHAHPGLRDTIVSGDAENPYHSPGAHGMAATQAVLERGFQPTRIDMGDVFSRTWAIFKENFGSCFLAGLIVLIANGVTAGIFGVMFGAAMSQLEGVAYVAVWGIQQLAVQAVSAFFNLGMIAFMLRVARGQSADLGVLFSGGKWILFGVAIQLIIGLAVMGGLILLIVPGVIIGLMLSQAMYMLVDQGTDIGGSLGKSVEATDGNKWTLFAIYVVAGLGSMVVVVLTCGLGVLLVAPYMGVLTAVIYLGVTGQRTTLDVLEQPTMERGFGAGGA